METKVLLDAVELGRELGISARTVKEYARRGIIPEIAISPKVRRYDLDEVLVTLKSRTARRGSTSQGGAHA